MYQVFSCLLEKQMFIVAFVSITVFMQRLKKIPDFPLTKVENSQTTICQMLRHLNDHTSIKIFCIV